MSVVVENLVKIYGKQHAVDGISFSAQKGEIMGFLGPNGAGKSTTMKIATCYIPPSSGFIKVCGYDVTESPLEVKKKVGYLPEHNPLYLDMYVEEYLSFSGSVYGLKGSKLDTRVQEMVAMVGLTAEKKKKIGALSKGYRQRVGLAQAMIHDPEVLILDEPTTGLDPNQILEIRSVIKELGKEKTVIFSTHIMQEVQALCDRVVIISKGKLVADNKVSELKNIQQNQQVLTLEFSSEIDPELIRQLETVRSVTYLGKGVYEVVCSLEKDIRAELFRLASEKGWTLIGMKQEERTLENVFTDLTGKK
ncbi:MAG TPA: gliding motility-associated ABC transporter ATP-binding subunit GldA [Cytophagaceae bacterium]|nr:gliding motility-associated ABC transporter ATP-binding subunit GldA [Cytophagaceae bacterium]